MAYIKKTKQTSIKINKLLALIQINSKPQNIALNWSLGSIVSVLLEIKDISPGISYSNSHEQQRKICLYLINFYCIE